MMNIVVEDRSKMIEGNLGQLMEEYYTTVVAALCCNSFLYSYDVERCEKSAIEFGIKQKNIYPAISLPLNK